MVWYLSNLFDFYTFHIYAYLGLSSTTWFVRISLLVVEIQVEWSL